MSNLEANFKQKVFVSKLVSNFKRVFMLNLVSNVMGLNQILCQIVREKITSQISCQILREKFKFQVKNLMSKFTLEI